MTETERKEKENARCRARYHRLKQNPEWYAKRMERNRKNLKTSWKRIKSDPIKKEYRYKKVREYQREWIKTDKVKFDRKAWRWKLKTDCLIAYSLSEVPICACCGEQEIIFLTLDHIDGGGNKHRKEIGGGGLNQYLFLRRNNYPSGFQVLCYNCNCAKGFFGKCPHQNEN